MSNWFNQSDLRSIGANLQDYRLDIRLASVYKLTTGLDPCSGCSTRSCFEFLLSFLGYEGLEPDQWTHITNTSCNLYLQTRNDNFFVLFFW